MPEREKAESGVGNERFLGTRATWLGTRAVRYISKGPYHSSRFPRLFNPASNACMHTGCRHRHRHRLAVAPAPSRHPHTSVVSFHHQGRHDSSACPMEDAIAKAEREAAMARSALASSLARTDVTHHDRPAGNIVRLTVPAQQQARKQRAGTEDDDCSACCRCCLPSCCLRKPLCLVSSTCLLILPLMCSLKIVCCILHRSLQSRHPVGLSAQSRLGE